MMNRTANLLKAANILRLASPKALSVEAAVMMKSLAEKKKLNKGNLNVLKEIVEALGYSFEISDVKEIQLPAGTSGLELGVFINKNRNRDVKYVTERAGNDLLLKPVLKFNPNPDHSNLMEAIGSSDLFSKGSGFEYGKFIYSDMSIVENNIVLKDLFYCVKKAIISMPGGAKTVSDIYSNQTLTDYPIKDLFSSLIKMGAPELAKIFLDSNEAEGSIAEAIEKVPSLISLGRGTCGACLGQYKLNARAKTVASHGHTFHYFTRTKEKPRCVGSSLQPLEKSSEGIEAHIKFLKNNLKEVAEFLEDIKTTSNSRRYMMNGRMGVLDPDSPSYNKDKIKLVGYLENQIRNTSAKITSEETRLRNWNPTA